MKKLLTTTIIVAILCVGQVQPVLAADALAPAPQRILITEVQTGGTSDATQEFVELYNPNDSAISVTGWQLQYRAASQTAAQKWPPTSVKAKISCIANNAETCEVIMQPRSRLVLVNNIANIATSLSISGGFSGTSGQIRLVQPGTEPIVHDFVGYGSAVDAETAAAPAPAAGSSIKRVDDANGEPIDTNNNALDFIAACGAPSPGQDDTTLLPLVSECKDTTTPPITPNNAPTEPPAADPPVDTPPITEAPVTPPTYLPILITELLPDPAMPQQDSTNEFIELYNPNDAVVTLKGYQLQTGSNYQYTYTLGDTPLGQHSYYALLSAVSKLSLANSGSGVRLIDPAGNIVAEVPSYGEAKEGQAWITDGSGWHWSLTPTPGAENIATSPEPVVATTSKTATKNSSAAKTTSSKTKTTSTSTTAKVPAAKKTTTKQSTAQQAASASPTNTSNIAVQYWLLIPLSLIIAGYVIYEYRSDIVRCVKNIRARISKNKTAIDDTAP